MREAEIAAARLQDLTVGDKESPRHPVAQERTEGAH